MAEAAVRVAVRVRPFNQREIAANAVRCVDMKDSTTYVYQGDAEDGSSEPRAYNFDYSLWSHFDIINCTVPTGYDSPDMSRPNVDQEYLYQIIGKKLLEAFWEGFEVCMFAYGQSGSGKSFSMTGVGVDCAPRLQGMIPRITQGVFEMIETAPGVLEDGVTVKYTTKATMLEIYLNKVYDLLTHSYEDKTRPVLEVLGTGQVKNLSGLEVKTTADVKATLTKGFKNQYKAPTGLNVDSSRGHTIFSLVMLKDIFNPTIKKGPKTQHIEISMKLVDLAGSERNEKVVSITKDRLAQLLQEKYKKAMTVTDEKFQIYLSERTEEGKAINGSLTNLGKCVSEVAKHSAIPDEKTRMAKLETISWRNSPLTLILKSALNGRCKTIMIAAVSPSYSEYPETISTLNYANEIKKIKSCAKKQVATETEEQKLKKKIKELEELLKNAGGAGAGGGGAVAAPAESAESAAEKELLMKKLQEVQRAEEEAKRLNEQMQREMEKVREAQRQRDMLKKQPHLLSIFTNDSFVNALPEGKTITCGHESLDCTIQLSGAGISRTKRHCTIDNEGGKITLTPEQGAAMTLNGRALTEQVELKHNDRLRMGADNYFRLVLPEVQATLPQNEVENEELLYTYDYLKREAYKETMEQFGLEADKEAEEKRRAQFEAELKEKEQKFKEQQEAERKAAEAERERFRQQMEQMKAQFQTSAESDKEILAKMEKEKQEFEKKMREKELQLKAKLEEEEAERKAKVEEEERLAKQRATAKAKLQYDLIDAIPYVRTSNDYAAELNLPVKYSITIVQEATMTSETIALVNVIITDERTKRTEQWDMDTFRTKYGQIMQEYHDNMQAMKEGKQIRLAVDSPFRVSSNAVVTIGQAKVLMTPIHNLIPIDKKFTIFSSSGQSAGTLALDVTQVYESEEQEDEVNEADSLDDVKSLKHLDLDFTIKACEALPPSAACDVECSFTLPDFVATSIVNPEEEKMKKRARELKEAARAAKKKRAMSGDDDDDDDDEIEEVDYTDLSTYGQSFKTETYNNAHLVQVNAPINWTRRIRIHNLTKRVREWLYKGTIVIKVKGRGPRSDETAIAVTELANVAQGVATSAASAVIQEVRIGGKTAQELHDELMEIKRQREAVAAELESARKAAEEAKQTAEEFKKAAEEVSKRTDKEGEKQQAAVVEAVRQGKVSADAELKKELTRLQEEAARQKAEVEKAKEDARLKAVALEKIIAGEDLTSIRGKIKDVVLPTVVPLANSTAAAAINAVTNAVAANGKSTAQEGKVADNSEMNELLVKLQEEKRRAEAERKRALKAEQDLKAFKEKWDNGDMDTQTNSKACTIL